MEYLPYVLCALFAGGVFMASIAVSVRLVMLETLLRKILAHLDPEDPDGEA